MTDNSKTNAIISLMVDRIVKAVHPLKIILFGSYARNSASPDSDVDLMVVLPDITSRKRITVQLYKLLAGVGLAKDIVVVSAQEVEKYKDIQGTLIRPVLLEGRSCMNGPSDRQDILQKWIEKAEHDLITAQHTLTLSENCPFDTICFHAQQAAEKYLKALLVFHHIDFPKVHDVTELVALLPAQSQELFSPDDLAELSPYAVESRYPSEWLSESREEAEQAVQIAQRVKEQALKVLRP